jgi:hypothetical protein
MKIEGNHCRLIEYSKPNSFTKYKNNTMYSILFEKLIPTFMLDLTKKTDYSLVLVLFAHFKGL